MIPPQAVFDGPESEGITPALVFQTLTSRRFLIMFFGTLIFSGLLCLTLLVSYSFFSYLFTILSGCIALLIFATFIFAQSSYLDGFFVVLGNGYFFVGFSLILMRSASLGLLGVPSNQTGNVALQIEIISRTIETTSFILGLSLCHRSYKGWKVTVLPWMAFAIFFALALCAVFWWQIFPETGLGVVQPDGSIQYTSTTFRLIVSILWPVWFAFILLFLVVRRRHFSRTVFIFLFVAILLRELNLILNAVRRDFAQGPLDIVNLMTRLSSFIFIYASIGTSMLQDPLSTLNYSLGLKQAALENQNLVIAWMIDQVPSICILTDESGVMGHVNKYGTELFRNGSITGDLFFEFVKFESDSLRQNIEDQFKLLIKNKNSSGIVSFTSAGTSDEECRVIEWTVKLVKSAALMSQQTSNTSRDTEMTTKSSIAMESAGSETGTDSIVNVLCIGRDITLELEERGYCEKPGITLRN